MAVDASRSITKQAKDFSQWYLDVIAAADLAEHSDVKGSMIIKPYGYAIWERMQRILDDYIKDTGHQNAYFPLLIPESYLRKEKEHVEGFSPEMAVVTHAGGEKLDEPLVIRPTSETIINAAFARWIQSWRDLPLLINQWANVVRWELRPRLFLRTTEFLWQEGHTAHRTEQDAEEEARRMLEVYREFVEGHLAIPVIAGQKTDSEKFAGALRTYCIEAIMPDGKALQMGTSHNLGQNFAKVFGVKYLDKNNEEQFVWQTSWGVSTRMMGGLIMAHGDDGGLILPPAVAPVQVVVVTIGTNSAEKKKVSSTIAERCGELGNLGVRFAVDDRENETLGAKIYTWEKKGVPIRIEIGPKDVAVKKAQVKRRDAGVKEQLPLAGLGKKVEALLADVQVSLFEKAKARLEGKSVFAKTMDAFEAAIEEGKFAYVPWAGSTVDELRIKEKTKATVRCLPFEHGYSGGACIATGKKTNTIAVFGR